MGAVTYPDTTVQQFITDHFVPVQFNVVDHPELTDQFHAHWTPTLIIHDALGIEHRRSEGYLDPKRFVGEMALARVKAALDNAQYVDALTLSGEAVRLTQGDAWREPEALYWDAVAAYRASGDGQQLSDRWDIVIARFPDSDWGLKANI